MFNYLSRKALCRVLLCKFYLTKLGNICPVKIRPRFEARRQTGKDTCSISGRVNKLNIYKALTKQKKKEKQPT